jgi:pSer/pThr/pTyr-binding forkhead associated (FHA) protein
VPTAVATQAFGPADQDAALRDLLARDAFLVIGGERTIPIKEPIITIGRRVDNDIVLDSVYVSRRHAQIRWRFGHFVLYDVSNRGRTQVNGEAVSECVLRSGDLIMLSDIVLIFGEGESDTSRVKPVTDTGSITQIQPQDEP